MISIQTSSTVNGKVTRLQRKEKKIKEFLIRKLYKNEEEEVEEEQFC